VLVMLQKPRAAASTLQHHEEARDTSEGDVVQQLLSEWSGGDCLPDCHHQDDPLPDDYLPDESLTDVNLPEVAPDILVREELTSPCGAHEVCVHVRLGFVSGKLPLGYSSNSNGSGYPASGPGSDSKNWSIRVQTRPQYRPADSWWAKPGLVPVNTRVSPGLA
jgi:hypothetical protein